MTKVPQKNSKRNSLVKPQMTITAKNLEELRALLDAWNIDHYRVRVEGYGTGIRGIVL